MDDNQNIELYKFVLEKFNDNEKAMMITSLLGVLHNENLDKSKRYINNMKNAYDILK